MQLQSLKPCNRRHDLSNIKITIGYDWGSGRGGGGGGLLLSNNEIFSLLFPLINIFLLFIRLLSAIIKKITL